jgi:hypothetical protein
MVNKIILPQEQCNSTPYHLMKPGTTLDE